MIDQLKQLVYPKSETTLHNKYLHEKIESHPASTKNSVSPRKVFPSSQSRQKRTLSLCSEICLDETFPKITKNAIDGKKFREQSVQTTEVCSRNHPATRNIGVTTDKEKNSFGCCGKRKCCCSKKFGKGEEKSDPEKTVLGDATTKANTAHRDSNRHSGTLKGVFELECSGLKPCGTNCKASHSASGR